MSLGLDQPQLLPLGALVALPLLLHLFARPRPRRFPFPSLMLLERAQRQSARVRRPRHWLLLLLRTLWVALLFGVFLQPRWFSDRQAADAGGEARTVIVVLDATASMRAREGAQSRYARASAEAVELLGQLSANDRANVIRVRAVPAAAYPEPGVNKAFLIDDIRRQPCTLEGGSLADALRLALPQLARATGPREIIVLSDFPAGAWNPDTITLPPRTTLRLLPVAESAPDNQAVTALRVLPAVPVAGQEFTLEAEVANFSDAPVRRDLLLRIGERREQRGVELPARGRQVVSLSLRMDAGVPLSLFAELGPDAFPADDRRAGVIPFSPRIRAGVHGDDDTARVWLRSLDVLPGVQSFPLRDLAALPEGLDVLLLSAWRGEGLAQIKAWAEAGGLLMIRPDAPALPADALAWLGLPADTAGSAWTRLDPPQGLRVPDPWPEALALFERGQHGSPARGEITRHLPYKLPADALNPILFLESGETVWGRFAHLPAVHWWNLSLSARDGSVAAQSAWIPMFGEWISGGRPAPAGLQDLAGGHVPVERAQLAAAELSLYDDADQAWPIVEANGVARSADPLPPGLYEWRSEPDGRVLALRALGLPAEEADLSTALPDADALAEGMGPLARAADLRDLRGGRPLWPTLLALAFLVWLCEHAATAWAVRT